MTGHNLDSTEEQVRDELEETRRRVEQERREGRGAAPLATGAGSVEAELEETRRRVEQEVRGGRLDPHAAVHPDHGYECPSCGKVYEQSGACVVDDTPLRRVESWTETVEQSDDTAVEEVTETAREHQPSLHR